MTRTKFADRAALAIGRQLSRPSGLGGRVVGAAVRVANRSPTRALIRLLGVEAQHSVLDIGCGDGTALAAIPQAALRCGIDHSQTMIDVARSRFRRDIAEHRVDLRVATMQALPFDTTKFDRFVASNVLYFCEDIPALLQECRRVANPGAVLGIYVTSAASMARWRFASSATHRHFDRATLELELEGGGIKAAHRQVHPIHLPGGIEGILALARLA